MIVTKTLKIETPKLPPEVEFIENKIKESGITPLRWAIVDVEDKILTVNASGKVIK